MNALEKLHALLVSDEINIWHFPYKKESPRFFFWKLSEPENREGYGFDTLETMIDAAYACIDPLMKPLPDSIKVPDHIMSRADVCGG